MAELDPTDEAPRVVGGSVGDWTSVGATVCMFAVYLYLFVLVDDHSVLHPFQSFKRSVNSARNMFVVRDVEKSCHFITLTAHL